MSEEKRQDNARTHEIREKYFGIAQQIFEGKIGLNDEEKIEKIADRYKVDEKKVKEIIGVVKLINEGKYSSGYIARKANIRTDDAIRIQQIIKTQETPKETEYFRNLNDTFKEEKKKIIGRKNPIIHGIVTVGVLTTLMGLTGYRILNQNYKNQQETKKTVIIKIEGRDTTQKYPLPERDTVDNVIEKPDTTKVYNDYIGLIKQEKFEEAKGLHQSFGQIRLKNDDLDKLVNKYGDNNKFCRNILVNHNYSEERLDSLDFSEIYIEKIQTRCNKFLEEKIR